MLGPPAPHSLAAAAAAGYIGCDPYAAVAAEARARALAFFPPPPPPPPPPSVHPHPGSVVPSSMYQSALDPVKLSSDAAAALRAGEMQRRQGSRGRGDVLAAGGGRRRRAERRRFPVDAVVRRRRALPSLRTSVVRESAVRTTVSRLAAGCDDAAGDAVVRAVVASTQGRRRQPVQISHRRTGGTRQSVGLFDRSRGGLSQVAVSRTGGVTCTALSAPAVYLPAGACRRQMSFGYLYNIKLL